LSYQPFLYKFAAKKDNKMLKFISFGSGSCGNCYYIYTDDYGIIIDIGISMRKLKKYFIDYGLSIKNVRYILVTHDHADHAKSVGKFSSTYELPVYATETVHSGIKQNCCVRKKVGGEYVRYINKGETLHLDDFEITPFGVPHDSMDNVGYKIKYGNVTFCLMTDVGHLTDEMKQIIAEADYLVIEANHDEEMLKDGPYPEHLKKRVAGETGHLSNKSCAKALRTYSSAKLKHVWLCHLSQENNHPELARKTVELELMQSENINTDAIQLDVLKRNMPSGIYELI